MITLAARIDALAREHGATPAFVSKVRRLFEQKGVTLESDAAPFQDILQDTFARDATIRDSGCAALASVREWRDSMVRLESSCRANLERLNELRGTLDAQLGALETWAAQLRQRAGQRRPDDPPRFH